MSGRTRGNGGFNGNRLGDHTFAGPATLPYTGFVNSDIDNGKVKQDAPPAQLYDLKEDPKQTRNLHASSPKIAEQMKKALQDALASQRTAPARE